MTRRVRRDLSDKQIRKIVREQFKDFSESPTEPPKSTSRRIPFLIIILIILTGVAFFLTRQLDWTDILYSQTAVKDTLVRHNSQTPESPSNQLDKQAEMTEKAEEQAEKEPDHQTAQPDTIKKTVIQPVKQKPQIEVLNGCGVPGVAKKMTTYLRARGFDVVYMGNYKRFDVSKTQILGWEEEPKTLRKLADVIGIDRRLVSIKPNPNKQLTASVVIGKNYRYTKPFKK